MLLSDLAEKRPLRLLLVGSPGTRKSSFICSIPGKTRILDFDGKMGGPAALMASKDPDRLKEIKIEPYSARLDSDFDPLAEVEQIINKELIPQQKAGKMEYDTLAIDSGTTFSSAVLRHIVKTNPGIKRATSAQGVQPDRQDFGILKREFSRLIPGLCSLPMNFVMTAHFEVDKSELTGEIIRKPIMDGSFASQLPIYFDDVFVLRIKDGKCMAQTQPDIYFDFCRSSIPGIPKEIELTYANLMKKYIV